jgi:hypothetical protein
MAPAVAPAAAPAVVAAVVPAAAPAAMDVDEPSLAEMQQRVAAIQAEMEELRSKQVGTREGGSASVRTPIRVSVPHLPVWDGKTPNRKADTFLDDVGWYAQQCGQAALELLPRVLAAGPRASWDAVCKRMSDKGKVMVWEDARREFKLMVGETYEREEENATSAFLDGRVRMAEGQSVADYRTLFDDKLRQAPSMPDEFAVQLFVRGLTPKLAKHCQGDASGHMFATLDAAFNYAVMAERIERTPGDAHKGDATKPVLLGDYTS